MVARAVGNTKISPYFRFFDESRRIEIRGSDRTVSWVRLGRVGFYVLRGSSVPSC